MSLFTRIITGEIFSRHKTDPRLIEHGLASIMQDRPPVGELSGATSASKLTTIRLDTRYPVAPNYLVDLINRNLAGKKVTVHIQERTETRDKPLKTGILREVFPIDFVPIRGRDNYVLNLTFAPESLDRDYPSNEFSVVVGTLEDANYTVSPTRIITKLVSKDYVIEFENSGY